MELEVADVQLRAALNVAKSKLSEVERREQALTSAYEDLKDFDDVCSSHANVEKEKADQEKTEREKASRFQNSRRIKTGRAIWKHQWLL
jgi:uncharacterized glyoxalase superfamily metalloenzyme YdcJ